MKYFILYCLILGLLIADAVTGKHGHPMFIMIWFAFGGSLMITLHEREKHGCYHTPVSGYQGGAPYASVRSKQIDGIQRMHAYIEVECRKCGEHYNICNLHVSPDSDEKEYRDIVYKT